MTRIKILPFRRYFLYFFQFLINAIKIRGLPIDGTIFPRDAERGTYFDVFRQTNLIRGSDVTRTLQRPTVNICRAREEKEARGKVKKKREKERKKGKRGNVKTLESFIRMVLYLRFSL